MLNDYESLGYTIYFWKTKSKFEIDFVLNSERGLKAFEIKRAAHLRNEDFKGLKAFQELYPEVECYFFYGGTDIQHKNNVTCIPHEQFYLNIESYI